MVNGSDIGEVTVFTDPSWEDLTNVHRLGAGPDGALYVSTLNLFMGGGYVHRVMTDGTVTDHFQVGSAGHMVSGPDGNLWYAYISKIARLTPEGVITRFTIPGNVSDAFEMTLGPDGAMWFGAGIDDAVGRVAMDGAITMFPTGPDTNVGGLTTGPDGAVWFTLQDSNEIGRITPQGVITRFPIAASPLFIAAGPDGALWFTAGNQIGRITTSGVVSFFSSPDISFAYSITAGPDGALWFVSFNNDRIGRISTDGVVEMVPDPDGRIVGPIDIVAGPDGNVWFTGLHRVGRITVVPEPGLSVVKSADATEVVAGEAVDFSVEVTNTGGVALTGVEVSDPVAPGCEETVGDLAVGASVTVGCSYSTSEADVGVLVNTATVDSVQTGPVVSNTVEVTVSAVPPPLLCDGAVVTVDLNEGEVASVGDDVINGTPGDDRVDGLGGDDRFCGRGGDDVFVGGWGADRVFGGSGDDVLRGGRGADVMVGRSGADVLGGGGGSDWLLGQDDDDVLVGGNGRDGLDGGAGDDRCDGRAGVDRATGCEVLAGVP